MPDRTISTNKSNYKSAFHHRLLKNLHVLALNNEAQCFRSKLFNRIPYDKFQKVTGNVICETFRTFISRIFLTDKMFLKFSACIQQIPRLVIPEAVTKNSKEVLMKLQDFNQWQRFPQRLNRITKSTASKCSRWKGIRGVKNFSAHSQARTNASFTSPLCRAKAQGCTYITSNNPDKRTAQLEVNMKKMICAVRIKGKSHWCTLDSSLCSDVSKFL